MLPLVEFVLEDGITDEEAIQILDLSIPKQKREEKNWQESRMGGILSNFTQFVVFMTPVMRYRYITHFRGVARSFLEVEAHTIGMG